MIRNKCWHKFVQNTLRNKVTDLILKFGFVLTTNFTERTADKINIFIEFIYFS